MDISLVNTVVLWFQKPSQRLHRGKLETSDIDDQSVTWSILSTASTSNMSFTVSTAHSSNIPSTNEVPSPNMEPPFKRQKTISESFSQIVFYQHGGFKSEKLINAIIYMIAKDNQPLSIVENK